MDKLSLQDIKNFHANHMKSKNWNIKVMGSKSKINMDELRKYGKVVELTQKDLFGYEAEKTEVKP